MAGESRYRYLAQSLPQIVFETDLSGRITFANCDALRSFGYTKDDVPANLDIFQLMHGGDRVRARRQFRAAVAGHRIRPVEYAVQRSDGAAFSILVFARAVLRKGRCVGITGIAINLTDETHLLSTSRSFMAGVTRAQEEERKRIARELHDGTGQSLAALSLQIDATGRGAQQLSREMIERLQHLRARTDSILEGIRRFCLKLRPEVLEQLGFLPALELLAEELKNEAGINTLVEASGLERQLPADTELALFRITQEALSNTRKHSGATAATVRVRFGRGTVRLTVSDNGNGFQVPHPLTEFTDLGKLGLRSMQERAHQLNGTLALKSDRGLGTTVVVHVRA